MKKNITKFIIVFFGLAVAFVLVQYFNIGKIFNVVLQSWAIYVFSAITIAGLILLILAGWFLGLKLKRQGKSDV